MTGKPTIKDVAELAGCGIATVSRVLNNSGPTSLEKRQQVEEAVEALGFQFNEMGRSLKSNQSKAIAVLVPTLTNPVFADAIEGIQEAASELGYEIILICSNYNADAELAGLKTLISRQVDGVILTVSDPHESAALDLLRQTSTPHCLIFNHSGDIQHSAVGVDNVAAARLVGDKMIELNHKKAAFVAVHFNSSDRSKARYDGFCAAFRDSGLREPGLIEVDYAPKDLEVSLSAVFRDDPDISVLFASNDLLALSCIRALRALGKRVPEDVSVVGFDGIAIADLVEPNLATVSTPCRAMGRTAAKLVISGLTGKSSDQNAPDQPGPEPTLITLPFEFRSGNSLAPYRTKIADERAATHPSAVATTPLNINQTK
ncbi:MAG: LacI family DNA-binding transcriptional regulator [Pseudomonadota bacterium]